MTEEDEDATGFLFIGVEASPALDFWLASFVMAP
jgi:hypothetical protein